MIMLQWSDCRQNIIFDSSNKAGIFAQLKGSAFAKSGLQSPVVSNQGQGLVLPK